MIHNVKDEGAGAAPPTAYGFRKDGTLGPEEPGRPVARYVASVDADHMSQFTWSDGSTGPADMGMPYVEGPLLRWRQAWGLVVLMMAGSLIGILGLILVPLARVFPIFGERSNCLFHAIGRMQNRGGYLIFTPSKYGWWTHVIYSPDLLVFEEYLPFARKRRHRLPPVIFRGHIQPWTSSDAGTRICRAVRGAIRAVTRSDGAAAVAPNRTARHGPN